VSGPAAIDHLAALARGGPAAEPAPAGKLLRRLSLDLVGLPPSVAELDAFERAYAADPDAAYTAAVDRLLASPRYGEARARRWLDLARYADTNGYEKDDRRTMWPWRDWVIDAYNEDLPFDEFTRRQLAGDLLPGATTDDRIATGFQRNTMLNMEGGTDPEEFRVAAVIDRVNTLGSVWLGSTLACAQCHTHKYDPFTQDEYYGLFAFWNQTQDDGNALPPTISAPTDEQQAREAELGAALAEVQARLTAPDAAWNAEQEAWERETLAALGPEPTVTEIRVSDLNLRTRNGTYITRTWVNYFARGERPPREEYVIDALGGARAPAATSIGGPITGLFLGVDGSELVAAGRADDGNFVLTDVFLEVERADGRVEDVRFDGAWADFEQTDLRFPVAHAIDGDPTGTGWAIAPRVREPHEAWFALREPLELAEGDRLRVHLRQDYGDASWLLQYFRLALSTDPIVRRRYLPPQQSDWWLLGPFRDGGGEGQWETIIGPELAPESCLDHDGFYPDREIDSMLRTWQRRPDWVDARVHALDGEEAGFLLHRTLTSERERDVLLKFGSDDSIKAYLNGEPILANKAMRGAARAQDVVRATLNAGDNQLVVKVVNYKGPGGFAFELESADAQPVPLDVERALRRAPEARTPESAAPLREHFRREVSPRGEELKRELERIEAELKQLRDETADAMILRERDEPRVTHLLEKGSFLAPGRVVQPHVPAALHPWPDGAPKNRLGLAEWLVAPNNPLTARVVANRLWEEMFGLGLVETNADFGTRGDPPSNQALLDWLAVELVEGGWSTKSLLRTIALSDTYRQSARVTPDALASDPRNVALTRGARFRLPAESVRDQALMVAGLLDDSIGGPSAFPPQPDGIWAATYSGDAWTTARDRTRWRRGLYTFLRRTAPYPTYLMFDATSREIACTRRARTNTPLQALAALNDPAFVEAAGGLAKRMMADGEDDDARLAFGFRACTARRPDAGELDVLRALLDGERVRIAADADAAARLAEVAYPLDEQADDRAAASERAPWIVVANALLNLDETLTRD